MQPFIANNLFEVSQIARLLAINKEKGYCNVLILIGKKFSNKDKKNKTILHFHQLKDSGVFDKLIFLNNDSRLNNAIKQIKSTNHFALILTNSITDDKIGLFASFSDVPISAKLLRKLNVSSATKHPLNRGVIKIKNVDEYIEILNISVQDQLLKKYVIEPSKVSPLPSNQARPWGAVSILSEHDITSVRALSINIDSRLSFQRHVCRDELFISQSDGVMLDIYFKDVYGYTIENEKEIITKILNQGDSFFVKRGTWHRLKADSKSVNIMEVSYGPYDQENDIERKHDDYGRKGLSGAV